LENPTATYKVFAKVDGTTTTDANVDEPDRGELEDEIGRSSRTFK
jgi:hypothetical protein